MIRNAWHISGGDGAAANSANLRVLVTHSDGEQTVVEIQNDLGLDPKDKKAVVARLRAQGVDVVAIPGFSDPKGAAIHAAQMAQKAAAAAAAASKTASSSSSSSRAFPTTLRNQVAAASSGQQGRDSIPQKIPLSEEMLPYVTKLRDQLKTRGANGFVGIQRCFRLMDEDSSGQLDLAEFKRAMKTANVLLTEKQVSKPSTDYIHICLFSISHSVFYTLAILTTSHLPRPPSLALPQAKEMFEYFDTDKSGSISLTEFLSGLRGPMCARRVALVDLAFSGEGAVGCGLCCIL